MFIKMRNYEKFLLMAVVNFCLGIVVIIGILCCYMILYSANNSINFDLLKNYALLYFHDYFIYMYIKSSSCLIMLT
jgi:hypothetical protein